MLHSKTHKTPVYKVLQFRSAVAGLDRFDVVSFSARRGYIICSYVVDVLWGQPIKLIQVASNSDLHENQWNDLLFFEIVPSHCFGASEASKIDCFNFQKIFYHKKITLILMIKKMPLTFSDVEK